MVERIKKIIEREGGSPSIFADQIGISRSSMNHILNGRNNPSLDVLVKILMNFESLNSDWLLFGKPPMYKGEKSFLQSSLFDDIPVNSRKDTVVPEYRKEKEIKQPVNEDKVPEIKALESISTTSKTVSKIMIFYSDNTYESFNPEKQQI